MHSPRTAVYTLPQPTLSRQQGKTEGCPADVKMTAAARTCWCWPQGVSSRKTQALSSDSMSEGVNPGEPSAVT